MVVAVIVALVRSARSAGRFNKLIPYMMVACYPFIWYCLLRNHSGVHSFMAYRDLVVTIFAGGVMLADVHAAGEQYRAE